MTIISQPLLDHEEPKPPQDHFRICLFINFVLGLCTLLPYNAVVSGIDYFEAQYSSHPDAKDVMFQALNYSNLLLVLILIKLGPMISIKIRMLGGYVMFMVFLVFLPMIPTIFASQSTDVAYYVTIVCVAFFGIATAIVQSTTFGLAGMFPAEHTTAIMSGAGVSGAFTSVVYLICKASFPADDSGRFKTALVYYIVSAFVAACCVPMFIYLLQHPFSKYHMFPESREGYSKLDDSEAIAEDAGKEPAKFFTVLGKMYPMGLSVFMVFVFTFCVFPAIMTASKSTFGMSQDWFIPVLICVFNFCDVIGRTLPRYVMVLNRYTVPVASFLRMLFIPFYILLAPPRYLAFGGDYLTFAGVVVFGLSNGYCSCVSMMLGPSLVQDHEKEFTGLLMTLFMTSGIFLGTVIQTNGFQYLVQAMA